MKEVLHISEEVTLETNVQNLSMSVCMSHVNYEFIISFSSKYNS
jgi:hypothetical protein